MPKEGMRFCKRLVNLAQKQKMDHRNSISYLYVFYSKLTFLFKSYNVMQVEIDIFFCIVQSK